MSLIIYIIAFLEGFTTLSVEIVALRIFTPVIGSNSISTSIILGVILLALSYGYYIGGKLSLQKEQIGKRLTINLLVSSLYYFFITFIFSSLILQKLLTFTGNYFFSILISSILLFFIPVFLASQTIPLLSELLKGKNSGERMGKLLFYSTIGSFIGSIGTSVIFFGLIGVFKTGVLSSIILSFSALLISVFLIKNDQMKIISSILVLSFVYFIFSFDSYKSGSILYSEANAYHNITIYDTNTMRIFSLDGGYSSGIDLETKKSSFEYIKEAEKKLIKTKAKNILVIGAAGFTFPNDISEYNFVENIDVIDVDSSLKDISEEYFLEKSLSDKIHFYPEPTRFFINKIVEKKYDFILVDAYSGKTPPSQLLTYEFFKKLDDIGNNIYLNIILDAELESAFSNKILATANKAFSKSYYTNTHLKITGLTNIVVTNKYNKTYLENKIHSDKIYTDNNNSSELDIFKMRSK